MSWVSQNYLQALFLFSEVERQANSPAKSSHGVLTYLSSVQGQIN